ncbi:MAG: pirin family protein [Burkholderiaceae bacterium]
MLELRSSEARGQADHGWLKARHSFSFGDYVDPAHMGFGPLRVINEDRIAPGSGFGTHGHKDMEIITYVLEGELAHQDSMGNGSVIRPGDVQRMSAGSGVMHSESNHAEGFETHLLQIWIEPNQKGIAPSYEEQHVPQAQKEGRLCLVASPEGCNGAVKIHQDARLYVGLFDGDQAADLTLAANRLAYVHMARGSANVNGQTLSAGDALKLSAETELHIREGSAAEVLVFDLPQRL